jgi:anti-sigma-K factor RskA
MAAETDMTTDGHEIDDLALEALAEAYAEPAPAGLRARLLATVELERERRQAAARTTRARVVGAVAAAIALVFAGLFARETQRGERGNAQIAALAERNNELEARLDELGRTLVGLRETLESQGRVLRLVGGPRILEASLAPQQGSVGAGRVLVDPTNGETAVVVAGLPPAGKGKTYELWAIRGKNAPEPAGLITLVDSDSGAVRVPALPAPRDVTAFAISVEPMGGSAAPTGPIVLVGAVAG